MTGIQWTLLLLLARSFTFAAEYEIRPPCETDVCPYATCNNCTATISLSCPLLTTTVVEGAESHLDCVCVPGAFGAAGEACTPCPYGTYAALPNQLECTPCLYGGLQNTMGATNDSVCAGPVYGVVVSMSVPVPLNQSELESIRVQTSENLNISVDYVSVEQSESRRRRRLLSATVTITISCASTEQFDQVSAAVTPSVVAAWFVQEGLPAPSLVAIELVQPTSPPGTTPGLDAIQLPLATTPIGTTPAPTPTPPLDSPVSTLALTPAIIGAAAGGVVALVLGLWVAFSRGGRRFGAAKQLGTLPWGMAAPARTQMQLFHRVRVVR